LVVAAALSGNPIKPETLMESQRYLRCLGQPALFTATGEPIRFRTRKHLALLVYIAVEGRAHRRDRLAELLWPKVSATEARHSLATALSTLRPRLGPEGLEASRDNVRLMPGRVSLDLDRLQAGDVLGSEVTGPLEVAAFLDGFDITDSAEFTHWKDRQQARLLPVIKDALVVLIDRCRRNGESRQIEQFADRMLALDDLSEEAIRAKMEARAFAGDRLTALGIFEEWKAKLAEDLQAVPSDLVEGMAVRLRRRGWERTTLANIPNVPTDQWRGRSFIGRTAEYRVLYEAWEGVRKGISGHAMILGDSGVGKTTLVERLTTAAGLEGAAISRVQCYDVEREIPYSTLSSLVLGLLDRPGVSATSPEGLGELARTVPEVRRRFPNIPQKSESQGETARIRLTEAFHEMLTAIAEEHPVILVVDDLHLADDVSLAVLHLIMRRARGRAIMVLLIARAGELAQASQAMRLRESTTSLGIRELELLPLGQGESNDMLRSLIQPDEPQPGVSDQRALLRAAAGYPMVLELLVQDWKNSGDQSLALSVNAMTADFGTPGPAQLFYRQILDRITRSLDSTTHNVLNLASILGHRLNDLSLYALVDLSIGQTMSGMAELVNRRVLRDGAQGLEFVNELVRAAAYLGVPPTLRRVLHGHIADRFIQHHKSGQDDLGLEIAWHCIRAGRDVEATPYLLSGARQAMRGGALEAAERGIASALPHLTGRERADAVVLLADILQEQGRWLESLSLLDAVRNDDAMDLGWISVLTLRARSYLRDSGAEETAGSIVGLVKLIRDADNPSLRIAAARTAATLVGDIRDQLQADLVLESVASIPMDHLVPEDLSRLSLARARLTYQMHDCVSSVHQIEAAALILNSTGEVSSTAVELQIGLGVISCMRGEYTNSIRHLSNAYKIAVRLGNESLRSSIAANLALVHGRMGYYEDQLRWAEECIFLSRGLSANYTELLAVYCASFASIFVGRPFRARELIAEANAKSPDGLPLWALQAWGLYSADLNLLLGEDQECRRAALSATQGVNQTLHACGFAGAFSRWTAFLANSLASVQGALKVIGGFAAQLASYDALDKAEILAAILFLQRRYCTPSEEIKAQLFKQLETLPPAVMVQMTSLRMLD
jgi:DNA-binding SARP family transcriptional activator/tetratricopeptide (TPR) repeat protein